VTGVTGLIEIELTCRTCDAFPPSGTEACLAVEVDSPETLIPCILVVTSETCPGVPEYVPRLPLNPTFDLTFDPCDPCDRA
jgi:hypothetical protein